MEAIFTTVPQIISVLLFSMINLHFVVHIFHRSVHEIWRHSFSFITVLEWDPTGITKSGVKLRFNPRAGRQRKAVGSTGTTQQNRVRYRKGQYQGSVHKDNTWRLQSWGTEQGGRHTFNRRILNTSSRLTLYSNGLTPFNSFQNKKITATDMV